MVSLLVVFATVHSAARADGLHALLSGRALPLESAAMMHDAWQSHSALHFRAASSANAPAALFSTDDLDDLLCSEQPCNRSSRVGLANWSAVRIARGRNVTLKKRFQDEPPTLQAVHDAFNGGWSLVIDRLNVIVPSVAKAVRALSATLGFRVNANAYLTPRGGEAFAPHFDWMESVVLQLEGSKEWRLWDDDALFPARRDCSPGALTPRAARCSGLLRRPHAAHRFSVDVAAHLSGALHGESEVVCGAASGRRDECVAETHHGAMPPRVVVLRRGDILFIPAGVAHAATWSDDEHGSGAPSLHLTLGVEVDPHLTLEAGLHAAVVLAAETPGEVGGVGAEVAEAARAAGSSWSWSALLHAAIVAAASPRRNDALALRLRRSIAPANTALTRGRDSATLLSAELRECAALLDNALANRATPSLLGDALRIAQRSAAPPRGEIAHVAHLLPETALVLTNTESGECAADGCAQRNEALRRGVRAFLAAAATASRWAAVAERLEGQARDEIAAWAGEQAVF